MDGTTTQLRLLRAAVFAALCVTLSATSHVLLSRAPLPAAVLVPAAAGVFAVAYLLAGRERGFWQIAGLLVPVELAVDFLFTKGQDTCYGASGGPLAGSWRSVSGLVCGDSTAAVVELPGGPVSPWLLLGAHTLVGLLAAWWLRRGEAASYRLLRTVTAYAAAPLRLVLAVVRAAPEFPSPARRDRTEAPSPAARHVQHSVVRRGPPCPVPAR